MLAIALYYGIYRWDTFMMAVGAGAGAAAAACL